MSGVCDINIIIKALLSTLACRQPGNVWGDPSGCT